VKIQNPTFETKNKLKERQIKSKPARYQFCISKGDIVTYSLKDRNS
jgi:hypothetical protein